MQMEKDRLNGRELTEEDRARAAADAAVRDAAALKRLEESDEAKRMNQMVLHSQCMAVRSAKRTCLALSCVNVMLSRLNSAQ